MAVLRSNLPVAAQPWGRDVDNRLGNLEINVTKTLINTAANDSQFKASLDATNKTITKLDAVVANIYTPGTDSINASKITSGTLSAIDITGVNITGSTIVGTTYKSAATGQRIEISDSTLRTYDWFGNQTGYVQGGASPMNMSPYVDIVCDGPMGSGGSLRLGDIETRLGRSYDSFISFSTSTAELSSYSTVTITTTTTNSSWPVQIQRNTQISGNLNITANITTDSIYASNWFRSTGTSGWYSETYGGGMHMTDATWVRVYNGKALLVDNDIYASGTVKTSQNNATGGGIWIGDDGDIVDLNDGFASMRFSQGVRIYSANKGGSLRHEFTEGGNVKHTGTYSRLIDYTRRAVWIGDDGWLGYNTSSRTKKQDIVPANIDVDAVLSIEPVNFRYISRVEKVGDEAAIEIGFIAEDLDEAGLNNFVAYGHDGEVQTVHYEMFAVALQAVARDQANKIKSLTERIEALENK